MIEWFKKLTPTMQIAIVIVIIILLIVIYHRTKGFIKGVASKSETKGQVDGYKAQGQQASFTEQQFKDKADILFYWMDGPSGATSRSHIYAILGEMNNDLDLALLERAFGAPKGYDLKGWIRREWFVDMDRINNGFASKGIEKRY